MLEKIHRDRDVRWALKDESARWTWKRRNGEQGEPRHGVEL